MKIKGRDFNFGRCLKIEFYKGNSLALVVEHKPEVNPDCYVAMDVTVTDMPSPLASNKPGFMGNVTIYNPSKEVLTTIASGATWLSNYVNEETVSAITKKITAVSRENAIETVESRAPAVYTSTMSSVAKERGMKEYYQSRLRAFIYAGYVVKGVPNYTRILGGYVNGSSFSHKGTDDVLKIGIYDIDINEISNSTLGYEDESIAMSKSVHRGSVLETKWIDRAKTKFEPTWDSTLVKYVKNFETEWLTENQELHVVYVKSLRDWLNSKSKTGLDASIISPSLKQKLQTQKMPNGGINAHNLAGMLDGLCANASVRVDWLRDTDNVSVNTYVIYPLGNSKTITSGTRANIQIWNYQNLLETPSIDGAGKMTIKMVFNPQCACDKSIALMLDPTLGETDVTRNIASFESSIVVGGRTVGSVSSTGNDAAVANNQITGNTNVQSQRKQANTANKSGYLFNTAFPIIRVEHTLSTYKSDWTTTVKTVPITGGLKFEG